MSCIERLVKGRAAQGEAQLKQALGQLLVGGLVRGYLPQVWVIKTEQEVVTVHADRQGNIRVMSGAASSRDGEITIGHDLLANGIRNGTRPPPGSYQASFYTGKGQAAFSYLRGAFGL